MSNGYKRAMDNITLSEETKKSILENTFKAANNKKKNSKVVYMRRLAGMAACLAVCLFSYHVANDYGYVPSEVIEPDVSVAPLVSEAAPLDENTGDSGEKIIQRNGDKKNSGESIVQSVPDTGGVADIGSAADIGNSAGNDETDQNINLGIVQSINPIQDSLDEEQVEKELGYSIKTPEYIPDNYQQSDISLISGHLVQITYENEGDIICYRTAKGSVDISGDFNVYEKNEIVKINNLDVTLNGDDSAYYNAAWADGDASYSISSDKGLEKETMTAIVESVR